MSVPENQSFFSRARSLMDPSSDKFHEWNNFKSIPSVGKKVAIIVVTTLAAVFSLGIFMTPVFRKLTQKFSPEPKGPAADTASKAENVAATTEVTPGRTLGTPTVPETVAEKIPEPPLPASTQQATIISQEEEKEIIEINELYEREISYTVFWEGKNLSSFPQWITEKNLLKSIKLKNNVITAVPDDIKNFSKLQELDLYSNRLTALPDSICDLTQLTTLQIGYNQIKKLPEHIEKLKNLTTFELQGNPIRSIPNLFKMGDMNIYIDAKQAKDLASDIQKYEENHKEGAYSIRVVYKDAEGYDQELREFSMERGPFSVEAVEQAMKEKNLS